MISIRSDWDIIAARMAARTLARTMGFNTIDQARIATATSELTRNIILYAHEGNVAICQIQRGERVGIEMIFEDRGPGIPDVDTVWRTDIAANGARGLGLSAARRLVDEMDINTLSNQGTTITCRKWLR